MIRQSNWRSALLTAAFLTVAFIFASQPGYAASFMQIEPAQKGDKPAKKGKWIELVDFGAPGFTIPNNDKATRGGEAGSGTFSITKSEDKSTTKLIRNCCQGKDTRPVKIHLATSYGSKDQHWIYFTFMDVRLRNYEISGDDQTDVENFNFDYGKVSWTYATQDPKHGDKKDRPSDPWNPKVHGAASDAAKAVTTTLPNVITPPPPPPPMPEPPITPQPMPGPMGPEPMPPGPPPMPGPM